MGLTGDGVLSVTRGEREQWALVVDAARRLLGECAEFVRELPDSAYTAESTLLKGGTIGKHLRHLTDHYQAISRAALADEVVDYDHRERDVPMECCRDVALACIENLGSSMIALSGREASLRLRVRVMVTSRGDEAVLGSTLGRELAFATHHAVHHQAMMRAIAAEVGAQAPCVMFGVAPSTANHHAGRAR